MRYAAQILPRIINTARRGSVIDCGRSLGLSIAISSVVQYIGIHTWLKFRGLQNL
jgi:hypothetical protein